MAVFLYPPLSAALSGMATESKQDTMITHLATIEGDTTSLDTKITKCDTDNVTVVSSALPTGAATAANQATANADLSTIAGDTTSLDTKVTKCDTDTVTISASLPAGSNNIGDVDIASALPAGSNTIGNVNINTLTPVDFLDSGVVDASSTNIPAGGLQVVASLAADVKELEVIDDAGEFMTLTDGADAVLAYLPLGGGRVKVTIASTTTLKLASVSGSTITSGKIAINFLA